MDDVDVKEVVVKNITSLCKNNNVSTPHCLVREMSSRVLDNAPSVGVRADVSAIGLAVVTECAECVSKKPQQCQWDPVDREFFCRGCFERSGISSPNPSWHPVPQVVCTSDQGFAARFCEEWRLRLASGNEKLMLGFDIEWRPNYVKGETANRVALLQLSELESGKTVLTRLARAMTLHTQIVNLLIHENVVLLGVGVKEDVRKLVKDFSECFVNKAGRDANSKNVAITFADLGDVAKKMQPQADGFSLKKLCAFHNIHLTHKTKTLTMTNWEKKTLTPQEVTYAAQDAECGLKIATKMWRKHSPSAKSLAEFVEPHVVRFELER